MSSRSPRGSLNHQVVLDAALGLVDRAGMGALTIRGLARELGRPPMTLYAHFQSKDDLLDRLFERLVSRLLGVQRRASWQEECEDACRHMRSVLLQHPHWVSLLTRTRAPLSALEIYDRLLRLMSKDGFREEAAMFALSSIMSHALGSVLVERMLHGNPPIPKRRLELVKGALTEMPPGSFPGIEAVSRAFDDWTFSSVFEVGLRSLIAGLNDSAPRRTGYRPRKGSGRVPRQGRG